MPNRTIRGEKQRHGETDVKGVDDRTGHMERETSVGGEKQGEIKSERSRWRKGQRVSE